MQMLQLRLINLPVSKWMSVLCLTSSSAPSSLRVVISTREPSNQTTHTWICVCDYVGDGGPVACVVNSRCFQQSLTWGSLTLSLDSVWVIGQGGLLLYVGRMSVCDCDWSYHTHRQGQLCSLWVQGKHLSVIAQRRRLHFDCLCCSHVEAQHKVSGSLRKKKQAGTLLINYTKLQNQHSALCKLWKINKVRLNPLNLWKCY